MRSGLAQQLEQRKQPEGSGSEGLEAPLLSAMGDAVQVIFVVGSPCAIPQEFRRPATRCPAAPGVKAACGERQCEWASSTHTGTPVDADEHTEALLEEQSTHNDLLIVDTVDEYSRSAEKMKAMILLLAQQRQTFEYLLKLDDDNVVDLARVACGLAAVSGSARIAQPCARAGLTDSPFGDKIHGPSPPPFWWSSFRQNSIQQHDESGAYFILPAVATRIAATVNCVTLPQVPDGTDPLASFNSETLSVLEARAAAPGRFFEVYAYGGSHVMSGSIVRWLARHPATMNVEDVWMEDVAFGLWCAQHAVVWVRGYILSYSLAPHKRGMTCVHTCVRPHCL